MTPDPPDPTIVLVCQCGKQQELPAPIDLIGPGRDGWHHCPYCRGTKFSVRLRVPTVKTEPAP